MSKRAWCTLLVISIVVAVITGAITAIWWHQHCCNDAEVTQQTDGTEIADSTDGADDIFALDAQYASSYLEAASISNYEMCEVNRQFAEKWKQEAQLYLNKICEIADEDLKQSIIAGQTAWENAYPIRIEENLAYLQYVYTTGTIVPILQSKYEYDIQRERAIELYEMYTQANRIWEIVRAHGSLPDDSLQKNDQ